MPPKRSSLFRLLSAFLFVFMVAIIAWWLLAPEPQRMQVMQHLRNRINAITSRGQEILTVRDLTSINIDGSAPEPLMIADHPSWANMKGKQRILQPDIVLSYKDALRKNVRLDKLIAIEAGGNGRIYALHKDYMRIYVFSEKLEVLSKWSLKINRDEYLNEPVAFGLQKDKIIVAGKDGLVGWWSTQGELLGLINSSLSICDLGIFSNGDILLVAPGNPHLLHRFSKTGTKKYAFGYRDSTDSPTTKIFDRALVAILPDDRVVLAYEYPYRIEFYDSRGRPSHSLTHPISFTLSPPEIEKDQRGRIKRIFRQIVTYDIKLGPDQLLYFLVRLRGAEGGDQWDVFSTTGEYLQQFYLPYNQRALCFGNNAVYVLGAYPSYRLEKYFIEDLTDLSQLNQNWRDKLKRK